MISLPPDRRMNGSAAAMAEFSAEQKNGAAGADAQPIFSAAELEQLAFRRFNPYASLTASTLSSALDAFEAGEIMTAARIWARVAKSDGTIITVKEKREEAVALRSMVTQPLDESPAADDQAAALKSFWDNVRAGSAINRHVTGGFSLLATQMMEAIAFFYAVHHIIWKPDAARPVTLPSGATVPSLGATFEYVPLELFEARTGELRFLGLHNYYNGERLEADNWLVTTGPGLMFAACILHYFARLLRHDGINFSEKFGSPGTLVHTTAQQNSPEGAAALKLAQTLASNYRGVLYGAAENKAEYLWPQGGSNAAGLPMQVIGADIKRELTSLWLGADLSTMSRGGGEQGVGASVQHEEQDKRERRDCSRLSETLNATIDPVVLRWFFGRNVPILAKTVIESPINEDRAQLRESVTTLVNAGAEVPIEPVAKRLGVPLAKEGEETFQKPEPPPVVAQASSLPAGGKPPEKKPATNSQAGSSRYPADPDLEKFLGPLRDDYLRAFADDLQPLRTAMEAVLSEDDLSFNSKIAWLRSQMGSLAKEIFAAPKQAGPLAEILRATFTNGYEQAAEKRSTTITTR